MNNWPSEMKKDKNNLGYIKCDTQKFKPLFIDNREFQSNKYFQYGFFQIPSTDDYIIKYCYTVYTRKQRKAILNMLRLLIERQSTVLNTNFPIGYCIDVDGKKLNGLIIKYYPNSLSFRDIMASKDLNLLMSNYMHDDDKIHNLFMLYDDILTNLEEMIDNSIYYTDINPGNIVMYQNKPQIIDFDHRYVTFDHKNAKKDNYIKIIIRNYLLFISETLNAFEINSCSDIKMDNLQSTKQYIKSLENDVRRR